MSHWRDLFWYEPTTPLDVKGGIRAQSKRGSFASKWWGKRWIKVMESFHVGARLQRGRSYARRGQVADLQILPGLITASVQGSRRTPYEVNIAMETFSSGEWEGMAAALNESPAHMAQLLRGEMPGDIEDTFVRAGLSLFPERRGDLETICSCPDWSNPCKHIAAVYYLLAEAFDQDPFLLFKLRGIEREDLVQMVLGDAQEQDGEPGEEEVEAVPPEPLPLDTEAFWGQKDVVPVEIDEIDAPPVSGALARRLGGLPFWRGSEDFQDVLAEVYRKASLSVKSLIDESFNP